MAALAERGYRTIGVDITATHLQSAQDEPDLRGNVAQMDIHALGFREASFASASFIEVLEHVEDPAGAIREAARALAPGGVLVLSVPYRGFPFETHGIRLGGRVRGFAGIGVPLLSYMPAKVRARLATARVFGSRELLNMLGEAGLTQVATRYLLPSLDVLEKSLPGGRVGIAITRMLAKLMSRLERAYGNRFGSTLVVVSCRRDN